MARQTQSVKWKQRERSVLAVKVVKRKKLKRCDAKEWREKEIEREEGYGSDKDLWRNNNVTCYVTDKSRQSHIKTETNEEKWTGTRRGTMRVGGRKGRTQVKILEWIGFVTKYTKENESWTQSVVVHGWVGNDKDQKRSQTLEVKLNNLRDGFTEEDRRRY